jgi:predicted membrane-bound mannosyltransferase
MSKWLELDHRWPEDKRQPKHTTARPRQRKRLSVRYWSHGSHRSEAGLLLILAASSWQRVNLTLRALTELGVVLALATWGYHAGHSTAAKLVYAIGLPVLGFGLWGVLDFRNAGRFAEPLRLFQELFISGLAALAWYAAGQHALGWALVIISVLHHILVYVLGGTLLHSSAEPRA